MKNKLTSLIAVGALLLVTACQTPNWGPKQTVGTVGGAAAGAVVGSNIGGGKGQIAATAVGTLIGAWLGSEIGRSLDQADIMYANQAAQQAHSAPVGETITWRNPETDHYGTITPVREGTQQTTGNYCREYQQTIYIDGRAETGYGQACQQADGSWQIVN